MKKAILTAFILASLLLTASCANVSKSPEPGLTDHGIKAGAAITSDNEDDTEHQSAPQTSNEDPFEEPIEGIISIESDSPEALAPPKPYEPPVLDELPEDIGYGEGRFLETRGGGAMILIDNYGPCSMSRAEASVSFDGLTDGDLIRVGYQYVMESYPGQMPVFTVEKLADGEFTDLDKSTLAHLAGMGWVDPFKILGDIHYIRTDGYNDFIEYPLLVAVTSRDELDAYYDAFSEIFHLGSRTSVYSDTTIGFADAMAKYDDAYFSENILYMAVLEEGSGSIRHNVTGISGGFIDIESNAPEVCTDDMAEWHILIEAPIGLEVWGVNGENRLYTAAQAKSLITNSN